MAVTEEMTAVLDDDLVLGRYRLGRRLGSGGFGSVHEAVDELLERWVAVKVIPADGRAPERARREAHAAARLDHPGIVAIYDAGEEPGARYLVSELVEGATLAALEAEKALSDRDVLRIGLSLADALEHAHERGVVHRDLKPQNVLVPDRPKSWRGAAKLADFGVAHLVGDDPLTMTGDVVGTLAYMAPEQAAGKRIDERTDLYSLSLVLYEALAGVNPVRKASPAQTVRAVGMAVPSLTRHRKDLPPELCQALDRALRLNPNERGTLADLADALEDAIVDVADEGGTIVAHPVEHGEGRLLGNGPLRGLARIAWLGAVVAAVGTQPPGIALLALFALLPLPLLLRRAPVLWPLPLLAPALAGAFPGLAGLAPRWHQRAALGALGAWWLLLAEPLLERTLLLGPAPEVAARHGFDSGITLAATEVLAPTFAAGLPALLGVWALAAMMMPWLVRGRSLALDVVAATAWAATLAAATASLGEALVGREPRWLVAGAVAAGALAVAQPRYFAE
jgi:hypothetical protein